MSISDLFHPNYYDLFCDQLGARQLFISGGRTMGYFYSASDIMVLPPTVGAAPAIVSRATAAATQVGAAAEAAAVLHIAPGVTVDLYINLTQPAEAAIPVTGQQRGYYLGTVVPQYVIDTGAATTINTSIYKSMFTTGTLESAASTLFVPIVGQNLGVSANIQGISLNPADVYVDQNDVYTLKISIVSGAANIYFYGAYNNYQYFFY